MLGISLYALLESEFDSFLVLSPTKEFVPQDQRDIYIKISYLHHYVCRYYNFYAKSFRHCFKMFSFKCLKIKLDISTVNSIFIYNFNY